MTEKKQRTRKSAAPAAAKPTPTDERRSPRFAVKILEDCALGRRGAVVRMDQDAFETLTEFQARKATPQECAVAGVLV